MGQLTVDRSLARAKTLARRGEFEAARALYDEVLARFPNNTRAAEARAALADPALTDGRNRGLQIGLSKTAELISAGRISEAQVAGAELVAAHPTSSKANFLVGRAHFAAGAWAAAAEAFASAVRTQPTFASALNNLGLSLERLGRAEEAVAAFERALEADASLAEAAANGAKTLLCAGRAQEALAWADRALSARPGYGEAVRVRGNALLALRRPDDACEALRSAVDLAPEDASAWCELGHALREAGRREEAVRAFEAAVSAAPTLASAHNNLGVILREIGAFDRAARAFREAARIAPTYAVAHHNLASVTRFRARDNAMAAMERLLADDRRSDLERMHLHFALGKAHDDLREPNAAFAHFAAGNRLRRAAHPYDPARTDALFRSLREGFADPVTELDPSEVTLGAMPAFIVGLPRSGTTLLEQILSSHPLVHGAGESDALHHAVRDALARSQGLYPTRAVLRDIRAAYAEALAACPGGAVVVTDKMLTNFQWVGYIALAFPEAAIIDMRRDPMAVGWSIFRQYFSTEGNDWAWNLGDIARYAGAYHRLMQFWDVRFADRVARVDYEGLLADQAGETERVLAACGLPFDAKCLDFQSNRRAVVTASDQQVRRGLYRGSNAAWQAYAPHLAPLAEALRDNGVPAA